MPILANSDITPNILISRFQANVVTPILSGAYHAGHIPMVRGFQAVPSTIMDHLTNVNRVPEVGEKPDIVNAVRLLDGLIDLTRNLTRVGTFTFTLWLRNSNSRTNQYGLSYLDGISGKCIFTNAYVRTQFSNPPNIVGTSFGGTISAGNLNQLFANIFQHWMTTSKHHHVGGAEVCHNNCHYNCHSNCHRNCHGSCHMWDAGTACHSNCHGACHTDCHTCHIQV